ncbi:HepT-like ribonuclease domain-containing protein [Flaviaesturariibacter aridisoli]|uniref:DUF86 domain-containing protein n=1 Tax=Flaviaesturariibacter aridisoli TaxID=2545761 RepID=A0A4R4DRP9_9BACT|nr:HepT-like ribonuclease domain-containing protein [Flaviaesturariibacter aridisoli]TCZ65192.1 DUF86 domain-containing protein [Flaviaesturariibacter aridisoli]
MQLELKTWAYDILTAIHEVELFLEDVPEFSVYQGDLKTKRAIERNLEIIGEAMNRMLQKEPSLQFSDARKIVDTRNRIIHGYDTVSDEVLWSIVTTNLQTLKLEVEQFLK